MSRSPGRVTLVSRRSRRRVWPFVLAATAVAGLILWLAATAGDLGAWLRPSTSTTTTGGDRPPEVEELAGEPVVVDAQPSVIARAGEVELVSPAARTVLLGFHEAGTPDALELEVVLPLVADLTGRDVAGEVVGPRGRDPSSPTAIVLPSRGRAAPAASALDVVTPEGEAIVAPVDGTVVSVERYRLYGRHDDVKVVLRPDVGREIEVVLLHLDDVVVQEGDVVEAGRSVIAGSARPLPIGSQVDRFTRRTTAERARPHVHLEVRLVPQADPSTER